MRTQDPDAHLSVRVQGFELVRASAQNPKSGVDGASTVLGLCALASSVNAAWNGEEQSFLLLKIQPFFSPSSGDDEFYFFLRQVRLIDATGAGLLIWILP